MPSILCYVPPSVEFLGPKIPSVIKSGPTTPPFSNQYHDTPGFQARMTPLDPATQINSVICNQLTHMMSA